MYLNSSTLLDNKRRIDKIDKESLLLIKMYQDYDEVPANHAPTYNDVPMHPLLAAINGNMDKYANAQDRVRYQNHFSYPMPPMADGTHLHDSYPTGGAAGWGVGQTGTGGTGHSGYGYESPSGDAGGGGHDYQPPAPVHVPTGGSYSHHTTGGTSYGGYAPTPPKYYARPQPTLPSKGGSKKKKKKNNSNANTMNALTLLAFFFFINLLQNCLKDNMEAMNPTVMVMTAKTARNRNNKLSEINSREQSTSSASAFTSGANIVVQPEDVVSAAAAAAAAASVTSVNSVSAVAPPAGVNLQTSPYSDGGGGGGVVPSVPGSTNVGNNFAGSGGVTSSNSNNNNYNNNQQSNNGQNNVFHQPGEPQFSYGTNTANAVQQHYGGLTSNYNQPNNNKHNYNQANDENPNSGHYQFATTQSVRPGIVTAIRDPRPGLYDSEHSYPNQTINSATTLNNHQHFNQHVQQQQQQHHTEYPHEHFEQEEYEPQLPQPQVQPQAEHHQHHFDQNQFQQHQQQQQQQQHYHDLNQQRPINQDQYEEDHYQQAPPHDHFQHHYATHHSQHPSSFHSHRNQQQHYPIDRHPLRPHRGQSESSHPWSYGAGSSSLNAYKRGSYTWSSDSLPAHVSGHNNFGDSEDDDDDPYADAFYTRSNKRL